MRSVRHLPLARGYERGVLPLPDGVRARGVQRADAGLVPPDLDEDRDGQGGERLLQVGDIARAVGKTVRAIHHYEEVGLLRPHARSKGRYRLYDRAAVTRVRWIGKLHDLGLSLAQIQEIVALWESAPSAPEAMARIRSIYLQQLEETRAQITRLSSLERELVASIDYLDTCDTCDPEELVAACTDCSVHDRTQAEPELVAGIHGGNGHSRGGADR
ncbi:MerR family transcriptional regulator [Polyangium spumosum]|uniref:MerR family transcriptional regulator n=1 Tax=Polyangium spumosum TaxID=889282 RepID=A0A6N7PR69_9BACT|nr:MerR family transcriptional regulator [Polyangium spumosum]